MGGEQSGVGLRVFGLWLLYAAVGLVLAMGAAPDPPSNTSSPTRTWTKVVAATSGLLLAAGALGLLLLADPEVARGPAQALAWVGATLGIAATLAAWGMIAADLRR